ncbi:MAG: MATE family efflux transporter [Alistipes sp.]|nr:MATE family efflux transporter [Alistipes sp.]MDE7129107.1 MATE family efflux transporter [Alistipes sp.]
MLGRHKEYYKQILRLAMPVVLAQAGQLTTQFADTAMVGRFGGEDPLPLAAVSLGSALFLIIYLGALGLALGITPVIGEHFAKGDKRRVAHLLQNSMLYCAVVGVAATGIALAARPLMWALSDVLTPQSDAADIDAVVQCAVPYFDMLIWSIVPLMIFLSFKQFLEGIGNTAIAMWIVLGCNALNVALNYVFIFGHCGVEPMGAEGAGLATLISRIVQMACIAVIVLRAERFGEYRRHFARRVTSWPPIRAILRVGYPIAFQMVLEASAFIATTILALSFGAVASSAFQITFNIANMAWMIIVAIGSASTIVVSHIYGAGDFRRLRPTISATYRMGLAWSIAMAAIFVMLRGSIPALFTDNEEVIALTGYLLIYISIYQISDGIQGLSISMLRGLQDVRIIMPIVLVSYLLLNIPIGYMLAFKCGMGPVGLVLGLLVGLTTAAVLTSLRVRSQMRRRERADSAAAAR